MTRDELERALRAGVDPHERAYRAAPLPASVEEAQSRLAIRRASGGGTLRFAGAMVAAALVVVAVVAGYGLVTRGPDTGGGPAASDSGSLVPPASASASASAGARPCRAADFAITSDPWDAGAGSRGTRVVFRALDSLDACVLGGRLVASIVDAQGAALVTAESDVTPTATVTGGAQLEIGVAWSNWCGASPAEPLELRVRFPFDASEAAVVPPAGTAVLVPPCMGAGQDTALSVTRFEASNRPPPEG
jgi:hypothetical protein